MLSHFEFLNSGEYRENILLSELSIDSERLLGIIHKKLMNENWDHSLIITEVTKNKISFKIKFLTAAASHFMGLIRKGEFSVSEEQDEIIIVYTFFIGGIFTYELILTFLFTILFMIFSVSPFWQNLYYAVIIYGAIFLLLWIITLISHGLFFNRIIRSIKKGTMVAES